MPLGINLFSYLLDFIILLKSMKLVLAHIKTTYFIQAGSSIKSNASASKSKQEEIELKKSSKETLAPSL